MNIRNKADFCNRLEQLLEESGLTQRRLAVKLHIANTTLNGYIRGKREPDFRILIRMAEYFKVTTDYLLGITERKGRPMWRLDTREKALLMIFRNLQPEIQDLLLQQVRLFQNYDIKQKE